MRRIGGPCLWLLGLALVLPAPAAAQVPAPAQREPYSVFVIGDSYGAGEGAPQVNGTFDDNGDLPPGGQRENWDTSDDGNAVLNTETERCHRSPSAPGAVASSYLAADFPDVEVLFRSVACSGASIIEGGEYDSGNPTDSAAQGDKGGVLRAYEGVDRLAERGNTAFPPFPPQLDQIDSILDSRGPAGSARNRLDALIVNAGGNDAGFASFVIECGVVPFKNCANDENLRTFRDTMLGRVETRYGRLAAALESRRATTLDAELSPNHVPKAVIVTALPNVARKSATSGSPLSDYCNTEPDGDQTNFVEAAEASFIENTVRVPLNRIMRDEVLERAVSGDNWRFVSSHANDFVGHAICQSGRWVNLNREALNKQSELDATEGLPAAISAGWVHPNARGYEQIAGALYRSLAQELVERFTPPSPPGLTQARSASGFSLSFGPVEVTSTTSGIYRAFKLLAVAQGGTFTPVSGADGLRLARTGIVPYERTGRYVALGRACGPLARDASIGCSAPGEARVSTLVPPVPIETGVRRIDSELFGKKTQILWRHAHAGASIDTTRSHVRVRHALRPLEYDETFTVNGNATVLSLTPSQLPNGDYDVTVQACNGSIGCSPVSGRVRISTSGTLSTFPLSNQQVLIANYSCSQQSIAWGVPARVLPARNGTDGTMTLEDEFPATTPSCLNQAPVGRLSVRPRNRRLRPGRVTTLVAGWEHPRAWTALRTVQIRLRSRAGTHATITFDRERETLTLAQGSRSQRARLGKRRRTLRAGAVALRLGRRTFRRPPKGTRSVSLRLRLQLGRALAGRRLAVEMAAAGTNGARQAFHPGGTIRVARR